MRAMCLKNVIPCLGNKYSAMVVVIIAFGVVVVGLSNTFLFPLQTIDYVVLAAEACIGAIFAIMVYGISRNREDETHEITKKMHETLKQQKDLNSAMARSAELRLCAVFHAIKQASNEVLASKQKYDSADTDERLRRREEIVYKCQVLENIAKEITFPLQSLYWMSNVGQFKTLHAQCAQDPCVQDDIDVSFCEIAKTEAQKRFEELYDRLEPRPNTDTRSTTSAGLQAYGLSISTDRAVYPPRGTVYVRTKIDHLVSGNRVQYEILDQNERVLYRTASEIVVRKDPEHAPANGFQVPFKLIGSVYKVSGAYTIRACYGSLTAETRFSIERGTPSVQSDKNAYVADSNMTISVIDSDANRDGGLAESAGNRRDSKLIIESTRDRINGYRLLEDGLNTGIFTGNVKIKVRRSGSDRPACEPPSKIGHSISRLVGATTRSVRAATSRGKGPEDGVIECERGEEISIKYTNESGTTVHTVRVVARGAIVEMDQKVYTCTDKVHITVVAPDLVDSRPVGHVSGTKSCPVSVKTSIGRISGYRLLESEPGSGVFVGSVSLTGFAGLDDGMSADRPFGETKGTGPDDGMLACLSGDIVEAAVDVGAGEIYRGAALTRWNIGLVQFLERVYAVGDSPTVRIVDPDMNLDSDAIDRFKLRVRSDSDKEGIELVAMETALASGIFEAMFSLDRERSSQEGAALLAADGDTIYAEYTDLTLPPPAAPSDSETISSTALVSASRAMQPPLERLKIEGISVTSKATGLSTLTADEPALIKVTVGGAKMPHSFMIMLQIKDSRGSGFDPLWHSARIDPQQTIECEFEWMPPRPDRLVFSAYLWKSLDDPTPFCPPKEISVDVV